MKTRTEFLFAHWAVASLKDLRGDKWRELTTRVAALPETHPDSLAFALTMIRINGCVTCDARRYRERGGCANCSKFTLTTLNKENDAALIARYRAAHKEITRTVKSNLLEKKVA